MKTGQPALLYLVPCTLGTTFVIGLHHFVSAYAIGLIITFVALAFMKTGQPALLYLVPCTLGTTFVIGLKRKEVRKLWNGAYHVSVLLFAYAKTKEQISSTVTVQLLFFTT